MYLPLTPSVLLQSVRGSRACDATTGYVHSAHDWLEVFEPIVARYRRRSIPKFFRGDAAFASPDLYGFLETKQFFYAIRLQANANLYRKIEHLLTRPVGRLLEAAKGFLPQFLLPSEKLGSATPGGCQSRMACRKTFSRIAFIVTSLRWRPRKVVQFYNKGGTAEQWIKEGKNAILLAATFLP